MTFDPSSGGSVMSLTVWRYVLFPNLALYVRLVVLGY